MLLPGRPKLVATPLATGSVSRSSATIGMVRVVERATCNTGGPFAIIRFTFFAINSSTIGAIRAGSPSAIRATNSTCAGAVYPDARSPLIIASIREAAASLEPG